MKGTRPGSIRTALLSPQPERSHNRHVSRVLACRTTLIGLSNSRRAGEGRVEMIEPFRRYDVSRRTLISPASRRRSRKSATVAAAPLRRSTPCGSPKTWPSVYTRSSG
jgi:hypothetical protein